MPQMDRTGPQAEGSRTGRGLGKCKKTGKEESLKLLGKGEGKRHKSGGGTGKGRRIRSGLK